MTSGSRRRRNAAETDVWACLRQSPEVFQSGVGDPCPAEVQVSELRESREMLQCGVRLGGGLGVATLV
jgi:hypothetical protein